MISLRQIIKEVVKEELPFENMDSAEKKLWRKFTKLIQRCGGDMETLFMGKGKIEFPNEEKEFVKIILVQLAREEGLSHKIWEDKDGSLLLKYMNRRSELMSAVSMNEAAKKTAQLENAKEARPPGSAPQEEHLPRKIFVCSPYRPTSQDEKCRKDELEANIRRAKMACRILSTLGFLPLAPHLYFTQFLKDEEKQERNTGIQLGMQWLEEADELWVFGSTVSEGMAAEIKRAHELQKKVRNLPEPGRVVELLLKNISEQYHVPLDDKKTEGQQEAAESEEDNGE